MYEKIAILDGMDGHIIAARIRGRRLERRKGKRLEARWKEGSMREDHAEIGVPPKLAFVT